MNKKLRWGILSTAKIGIKAVIPAIKQSNNGEVAAIASRRMETALEVAKSLDIPRAFGSYEELLESREVDAVYIPLPNNLHKEWAVRAAEHGKHILCEKPFALNAAEVDEMISAAQKNHVLLMEAFMYRFHPQFAKLKSMIADGTIGNLQIIRSAFCFRLQDPHNIRLNTELGGGALMDVGCYCVNMSRLVAGAEPLEVEAIALTGKSGVDETLIGILRFPDDVTAHFDCSFRTDYREWLEVQGTARRMDLPRPIKPGTRSAEIFLRYDENDHTSPESSLIMAPAANHYRLMVQQFAQAALEGKDLPYPPEDGRANMRVIDALFESARTGRSVRI
ncbi:MAG TPA: Gfo/Idh/MocA family oxidoreductase [Anaerolineae bacterium]